MVVLIDEYEQPIIDNLHNPEVAEGNRRLLQSFFKALKSFDKHIKFTFITEISRFSRVSIFSGANHLKDISMDNQVCRYDGLYTRGDQAVLWPVRGGYYTLEKLTGPVHQ